MTHHNQHSEWMLDLAIQIDEQSLGFCGAILRASAEKRHVIAAYLAGRSDALDRVKEVAPFLLSADHRTILAEAFGEAPEGLRGALRRSGPAVHEKRFYSVLKRLLAKPRHAEIVKCINRLDGLNLTKLRVLNVLPPNLCRPNVVEVLPNVRAAGDLIQSLKLLAAAGADEGNLVAAIRNVRDDVSLTRVISRAMLACRAGDHPVPPASYYRPVRTARELHQIATKFRNCARNYTVDFLDQEAGHAFAEVRHAREGAVVHLRRREGKWRLDGVFGPRNLMPSSTLRQLVAEHLSAHGVESRERHRSVSAWSPVRRITASRLYEFDLH